MDLLQIFIDSTLPDGLVDNAIDDNREAIHSILDDMMRSDELVASISVLERGINEKSALLGPVLASRLYNIGVGDFIQTDKLGKANGIYRIDDIYARLIRRRSGDEIKQISIRIYARVTSVRKDKKLGKPYELDLTWGTPVKILETERLLK